MRKLRNFLASAMTILAGVMPCSNENKMQNSKKPEQPPLHHYHENWWKVENEPIWYLAGNDYDSLEAKQPGKWYFTNEADMFSAPFDTYAACAKALDNHVDYLNL